MDWLLSPATPEAGSALRREIADYLRRHSTEPDMVGAAEVIVSELVMNAVEHAGGPVWVCLDWTGPSARINVHDLGPAFVADLSTPQVTATRGRGLWLVSQMTSELEVVAKAGAGKTIRATLPLIRREEPSFDPPARMAAGLPHPSEAGPRGFGRESFLRALVVELAHAADGNLGPQPTKELIAQVGTTVGSRMEQEFRAARRIVGRLTAQQQAECFVRLKAAIDGDFYIIEASEDRIVLGNRRCPFGAAVQNSPSLCRITSSVFGGIAARNTGQATVDLVERIAVGDPHCRVVIHLGAAADRAHGHHYRS
ncbi:methanogen output domain 1-containing protein [Catellatospora sp. NPDC049609]|uniref:ATP-binding protein n=1 Tax=Catellatospora sp. NPDC049609 TaxID=3155505 RepID=UPI0034446165